MTIVKFEIPGKPQAKQRARVTRWGTHTPEKTVNYEAHIKQCFMSAFPKFKPMTGALNVEILSLFTPPVSTSKRKVDQMLVDQIKYTKKPDVDNVAKIITDALNSIAYKDDAQINNLFIGKRYSDIDKVIVKITEVKND